MWVDEAFGLPGGHVVQMERTRDALTRCGIEVQQAQGTNPCLDGVDVVHAWGGATDDLRRARVAGIPIVMSTIYPGIEYALGQARRLGVRTQVNGLARLFASSVRRGPVQTARRLLQPLVDTQRALELADLLLPNSDLEGRAIRDELQVSTPYHVVPNGADPSTFMLPAGGGPPREGVLYAARLEPHKNQLGLIKALRGTDLSLTLVGAPHPHHPDYARRCRAAAGPTVRFMTARDQDGLRDLYQRAEVHAMPSWAETTGLASLEAALCGAAVVTTNRGFAREYLRDLVEYCEPGSDVSIRQAIERARRAGPSAALHERITSHFTWDHAAAATVAAYDRVAPARGGRRDRA